MEKRNSQPQNVEEDKICPNCGHTEQALKTDLCEICSTRLIKNEKGRSSVARNIKSKDKKRKTSLLTLKTTFGSIFKPIFSTQELKKPINLIGLVAIGLSLSLWIKHLWLTPTQNQVTALEQLPNFEKTEEKTKVKFESNSIPKGLFSSGGASFFAPLVSSGLNVELAEGDSSNYIDPLINSVPNIDSFESGEYALTRRLFLVYRDDETLDREAGKAYADYLISQTGQKFVKKAGFVPLYQ